MKTYSSVWPFSADHIHTWAYYENALTKEECEQIITYGNTIALEQAGIGTPTAGVSGHFDTNINYRNSLVGWIYPTDEIEWLFRRISSIILDLNENYFKFDLFGLIESLQFTRYDAPEGRYGFHIDKLFNGPIRKLSIVIQLSEEESYEGGNLELLIAENPGIVNKSQGYLVTFPSYTLHQVTPVTRGTRYSLVAWVTGPNFK